MKLSNLPDEQFELLWFFLLEESEGLTEELKEKYSKSGAGRFLLDNIEKYEKWERPINGTKPPIRRGMYLTMQDVEDLFAIKKKREETNWPYKTDNKG